MGARSGYTLLTGLFVGIGGMLGIISGLVQWLPLAVLAPIIVYVAIDITTQAFQATPHATPAPWCSASCPPSPTCWRSKPPAGSPPNNCTSSPPPPTATDLPELAVIFTLGNGFIITAMLWTAAVAAMVDGRLRRAAVFLLVAAALALFGLIHSVDPRGGIYLPWHLEGLARTISWQFVGAYVVLAAVLGLLSFTDGVPKQSEE